MLREKEQKLVDAYKKAYEATVTEKKKEKEKDKHIPILRAGDEEIYDSLRSRYIEEEGAAAAAGKSDAEFPVVPTGAPPEDSVIAAAMIGGPQAEEGKEGKEGKAGQKLIEPGPLHAKK